ncbi:divalent-cation tolerance protein CutA [Oceanicaulis sp. LC35]|uniref:divalent-cation tolerance protein CutA n=1 Tax=Oceanicaulis sp. LC35 TaxID=3349635 RepID=UPI003F86F911
MTDTTDCVIVLYTTWPDMESVERAASRLLQDRLIACANILGESRSIYRWEGAVQSEREIIALFKTSAASVERARDAISALHPYDEPCILALESQAALSAAGFTQWVRSETA